MTTIKYGILIVGDVDNCIYSIENYQKIKITNKISKNTTEIKFHGMIACEKLVKCDENAIKDCLNVWCSDGLANVILVIDEVYNRTFNLKSFNAIKRTAAEEETTKILYSKYLCGTKITPMSMLSSANWGINNKTLILNLRVPLEVLKEHVIEFTPAIKYAVDVLNDSEGKIDKTFKHSPTKKIEYNTINDSEEIRKLLSSISLHEAKTLVLDRAILMDSEIIEVEDVFNRVIKNDIFSERDIPNCKESLIYGFAVYAADGNISRKLSLGHITKDVSHDPCRLVTEGTTLPDQVAAVFEVKDTEFRILLNNTISFDILVEPKLGQNIKSVGDDIKKNELVLPKNTKITIENIVILRTAINTQKYITVYKKPEIAIIQIEGCTSVKNKYNILAQMSILKENGFNSTNKGIIRVYNESLGEFTNTSYTNEEDYKNAMKDVDILICIVPPEPETNEILKSDLKTKLSAVIHFERINLNSGRLTTFATSMRDAKTVYIFGLQNNLISIMQNNRV
ncbi:gephyrin-like [Prorops nasuta]|uniref:gephyrin-like n=1 Tax=Prorops nasuta TaxID=863751 RepID=UPI0034CD815C